MGLASDRDPGKRPKMGAALGRLSDYCILTSDNPRSESPQQIVDAMEKGLVGEATGSVYEVCLDRREAIRLAIEKACPGDVVVIAGKGHETYQEIMGERHRFDDREIAREFCRERMRNQSRER